MADQAAEALGSLSLGAEERQPASAAAPAERQRGTVRWFNASKGFGFIQPESAEGEPEEQEAGTDLFVHQTSIRAEGFRSLREGEPVEFDIEPGEDGRNKAINVSGPGGAPPLGAPKRPQLQQRRQQQQQFQPQQQQPPSPLMMAAQQQQQHMQPFGTGGYGYPAAMYPPSQFVPPTGPPGGYQGALAQQMAMQYGQRGGGDPSTAGGMPMRPPMGLGFPGGRGGRGGRGYLGAPGSGVPIADRRPPPGTPGISSGLQVVVHNLPWTCSWQQLKDAFVEAGVPNIERADVIIDSSGRSRGFGTVSFPTPQDAANAVQMMNNADIGGRAVTVRIDRFA